MEKTITTVQGNSKTLTRLTKNSKLFKTVVNAIKDKKGDKIVSLDLKQIDEAVADFFIICEGGSNIQLNAIADHIIEMAKNECDERPFHVEFGDKWTILDFVNLVVHIFQREQRLFYNLETLWGDANKTDL